jgi:hypothetical protein
MTPTRNALCGLLVIASALLVTGGCANREHIRDDYGERVRTFQNKQRVYAHAASGGPTGLDSEESSAIHKSYRTGLGGKAGATPRENRVLILGEAPNEGSK